MLKSARSSKARFLDREHLTVVISILLISLHVVDDVARLGDPIPPPFLPLLLVTVIYSFLPVIIRAPAALALGATFFIAQIVGHVIPFFQRGGLEGSDASGLFSLVGGLILIGIAVQLLKHRYARS